MPTEASDTFFCDIAGISRFQSPCLDRFPIREISADVFHKSPASSQAITGSSVIDTKCSINKIRIEGFGEIINLGFEEANAVGLTIYIDGQIIIDGLASEIIVPTDRNATAGACSRRYVIHWGRRHAIDQIGLRLSQFDPLFSVMVT